MADSVSSARFRAVVVLGFAAAFAAQPAMGAPCPSAWDAWGTAVGSVDATVMHDDGTGPAFYVGGWFYRMNGVNMCGVAKRGPAGWEPVLPNLGQAGGRDCGKVSALASFNGELYAGGWYEPYRAEYVGPGVPIPDAESLTYIARWDGTAWRPLTTGVTTLQSPYWGSGVYALHVHDDGTGAALYVGGQFWYGGGIWTPNIARWDGQSWTAVGNDPSGRVTCMASFDADGPGGEPPHLYVGGSFTTFNGVTAHGLARWNGSAWSSVPGWTTLYPKVSSLEVFDDDGAGPNPPRLFVGSLSPISETTAGYQKVAAWDGTAWTFPITWEELSVSAMTTVHENGKDVLYLGSAPLVLTDNPAQYSLLRFDGTNTTAVPGGILMDPSGVRVLAEVSTPGGPGLFVGGVNISGFDGGNVMSGNIGVWAPGTDCCPADFNGDTVRNVADLFAYINAWLAKTINADFNDDDAVNVADLFSYINAWLAGC